ncbi:GMC family oxidoreductase [Mycobacterium kyogaense]|uniref:GMC family oxidoreductase n=1 Tax=Mycobacterium kyogaense TaxID=2212479 RepID=UPI000DACB016|nr:GMC family oxidoreductase N-terminal domain-containing protein [Mycobacterium kyogaense]
MSRHDLVDADYVVVGAGSAGSIIASRLASAGATVVIVEAGGTDRRPDVYLPFGMASLFATANWKYPTAPDPSKGGHRTAFAAGRVVGGSGSINAMVFNRGRAADFDGWAAAGATGWSYADVLPHFRSLERWVGGSDDFRGASGPIGVSWCGHDHELDAAFVAAANEAGHEHNPDQNGRSQIGVARCQVNQWRGLRFSSARGYLRGLPEVQRPRVMTRTRATRVVVESGRAVAVECDRGTVRAREAVIRSAGAIGTPALLLRSGIGPGGAVLDLPGVGENFQDHLVVNQHWEARVPTLNTLGPVAAARGLASLARHGTGPMTTTPFEAQLFTDELQVAITPVRYFLVPVRGRAAIKRRDAFSVFTVLLHPEARGRVSVRGDTPVVEMDRLAEQSDVTKLMDGAAMTRDLIENQPAMKGLVGSRMEEPAPNDRDWLTETESSIWHAVGTCRMGLDEKSVVDPQLRVHGIDGLRVVDASVMPTITSGNTNAPTMMIAHRAAGLMLQR